MNFEKGNELLQAFCTERLLNYTRYTFLMQNGKEFVLNHHHKTIEEALMRVVRGETTKLIINIAPRYTKTDLAVKKMIGYGFALNPKCKFMHLSYSDDLAIDNSDEVRDTIKSEYYQQLFPYVQISKKTDSKKKWYTTAGGGVYATSTGGQVTGFGAGSVDNDGMSDELAEVLEEFFGIQLDSDCENDFQGAIIIDDPIKPEDALSTQKRETVNRRFENTIRNRVNSRKTPIIIIMQRVHENDLCGYLQDLEPGEWEVVSLPCIYEDENGKEKALWEFKHTLEELYKKRKNDSWTFDTQYQQNPKPIEGLLFHESTTKYYDSLPENPDYIHIQIDPADEGNDKLCSVVYFVKDGNIFIADVIYTKDNSELTIPRILHQIKTFGASSANIESNAGWALFRKDIKNKASEMGLATSIRSINAKTNKEIRIFNHAPSIIHHFYYARSGNAEYNQFLKDKHRYLKMVKDQSDDGVDTDAAACEFFKKSGFIPVA